MIGIPTVFYHCIVLSGVKSGEGAVEAWEGGFTQAARSGRTLESDVVLGLNECRQ